VLASSYRVRAEARRYPARRGELALGLAPASRRKTRETARQRELGQRRLALDMIVGHALRPVNEEEGGTCASRRRGQKASATSLVRHPDRGSGEAGPGRQGPALLNMLALAPSARSGTSKRNRHSHQTPSAQRIDDDSHARCSARSSWQAYRRPEPVEPSARRSRSPPCRVVHLCYNWPDHGQQS
jgi:hypothetical protein